MSAGRGVAPLADIPNGECRDGGPELVIRGEDAWLATRRQGHPWLLPSRAVGAKARFGSTAVRASGWPVPVLPRWRHEVRQTIAELKRREFDDAVGITDGCGTLSPAAAAPRRRFQVPSTTGMRNTGHFAMSGFRVFNSGKREKSRSAVQSSATPWFRQMAAMRAS